MALELERELVEDAVALGAAQLRRRLGAIDGAKVGGSSTARRL